MWLTDLKRLADPKYGLKVVFESGWERRGASGGAQMKRVVGALWHHDVAPRKGTYPLRKMLRDGRAGLSGPLCHIGFDRDGVVHVVGAGKANHAGKGKVPGVPRNGGNTSLLGIEMTSAGTKPWDWTAEQLAAMPLLGAALGDIFGYGSDENWGHMEYSSTGKIDPAGLPGGMSGLRSRIRSVRFGAGGGAPRPTLSQPTNSGLADVDKAQAWLKGLGYDPGPIDGKFGSRTESATKQFQTDFGIRPADGRPGPATRTHLEDAVTTLDEISKQIKDLPAAIHNRRFPLEGMHKGLSSTEQTKMAYEGHNHTRTHQLLAAVMVKLSEQEKLIELLASQRGITPAVVAELRAAAAEGAAEGARRGGLQVSAEDVAALLKVTTVEES